jgi:hypothetical protein
LPDIVNEKNLRMKDRAWFLKPILKTGTEVYHKNYDICPTMVWAYTSTRFIIPTI